MKLLAHLLVALVLCFLPSSSRPSCPGCLYGEYVLDHTAVKLIKPFTPPVSAIKFDLSHGGDCRAIFTLVKEDGSSSKLRSLYTLNRRHNIRLHSTRTIAAPFVADFRKFESKRTLKKLLFAESDAKKVVLMHWRKGYAPYRLNTSSIPQHLLG
ncbi:hypothetical protein FOZ60_003635 [Perkinsus olseni]|uniref:Uncharacterized protein n=1 Tax=Perkinsus olseni TaxID=32597 RepID=A0A7J6NVN4_PEROL|nr:hypothetical protein FOZ60_003635 [Perkinsus olseni]